MLHRTLSCVLVALHAASITLLALALPYPEINVTDFTITSSSSDVVARTDPMRAVPFTPLLAPLRCIGNNVFCLSIQMANEAYKEFLHVDWGGWSWIEDTPGQEWRTFGFAGSFTGSIRMHCRQDSEDDFTFSFGQLKSSYMSTYSRELRGHTSDGKTMSAVSAKRAVATRKSWVDFHVWCRDWENVKAPNATGLL
ncbi:hypothetical protein BDZ90DRAFT_262796 [Jaminaea rosea]|uniref:Uncharacterized protein n=1 Tax=Jaminaea rosea TaxID=1569628 RepID=A0A316UJ35_9BASI|nr:hypothetical protein BDZ90DRAFT_262796 [Jaminaea rosea]PWN24944.1 hypothetical protein BDZ90DRAFT_262796 [Jaminaea rosea]